MTEKTTAQYSEREAQRRFKKLVKAALSTPPKPLKDKIRSAKGRRPSREKSDA